MLKHEELMMALYLATELQCRDMCYALSLATKDRPDTVAQFISVAARNAWELCTRAPNGNISRV